MEFETLLVRVEGAVALLTVNRPDKLNALNAKTFEELGRALDALEADPAVRAVVVTGAGEKAFVAGADISELAGLDAAGGKAVALSGQAVFARFERFPKPVVAAVNGFALGGGCEFAMACHIRLASTSAQFGQPEVNLGLTPGYGGTQRLVRLVGRGPALELLLTGNRIGAERARELGLVTAVHPPEALLPAALELAAALAAKAPVAQAFCIEAVALGSEMPLADACFLEATLFGLCFATQDMREGTAAFLEKRKPAFQGR